MNIETVLTVKFLTDTKEEGIDTMKEIEKMLQDSVVSYEVEFEYQEEVHAICIRS